LLLKIRQSNDVTGISIFEQEIKLNQFVDDTNFFSSDAISVEYTLKLKFEAKEDQSHEA